MLGGGLESIELSTTGVKQEIEGKIEKSKINEGN
jgi:hypothetical protein